ncbi:IS4 family transposase, partial [Desulfosarcina sp. OttesenSCG-928-B08]|nr:IS4 family transposase [Desulfosarcina sp. OttesenSCG-928-B08]
MKSTSIDSKVQAEFKVCGKTDNFFMRFKIPSLMHQRGIRKHHGHSVGTLALDIFKLPFIGMNFFRGIVQNADLSFGKDAACELLKGVTYNWRKLLLRLAKCV